MIEQFFPKSVTRVVVALQPINMRLSAPKIRSFCEDELGIVPNSATAFLFANARHDRLLLFSTDERGDQTLMKELEKGAFLMPAPEPDGARFLIMRPAVLSRMFR